MLSYCLLSTAFNSSFIIHHSSLKNYPAEFIGDVEVGFGCVCGLPCEVAARRVTAYAAEEVRAPAVARARRAPKSLPRDAHRERRVVLPDARGHGHVRAEVPVGLAPLRADCEREVNPLARRRDLELEVVFYLARLRRDEKLAHVPVPKADGLLVEPRRGAHHETIGLWDRDVCELFITPEAGEIKH